MNTWKHDPKLELQRITARNFRRIADLVVDVPKNTRSICFVGPNGAGKSAFLSILVEALCQLTCESAPDLPAMNKTARDEATRRHFTTGEVGQRGGGYSIESTWAAGDSHETFRHLTFVRYDNAKPSFFLQRLMHDTGIPSNSPWAIATWRQRPSQNFDLVARSVFLVRRDDRVEPPVYEQPQRSSPPPVHYLAILTTGRGADFCRFSLFQALGRTHRFLSEQ